MKRLFPSGLLRFLGVLALIAYPFAVWLGLSHWPPERLVALLGLMFILRMLLCRRRLSMPWLASALALTGIVLCVASLLLKQYQLLLYYPVIVNALMLVLFGLSLFSRASLVERLARLQKPNLSPAGVAYTRKVTIAWCLFFLANGCMALFSCLYGTLPFWALYNGAISYLLMALLMGIEWRVRKRVQVQH